VTWSEGVRRAIAWHEAEEERRTIDAEANRAWDTILAEYAKAFPESPRTAGGK
jgi:hypothetical protein